MAVSLKRGHVADQRYIGYHDFLYKLDLPVMPVKSAFLDLISMLFPFNFVFRNPKENSPWLVLY